MRDAVLQRGVRADEAAPGSGLGLAIVHDLAELYGGGHCARRLAFGGLGLAPPAPYRLQCRAVPRPILLTHSSPRLRCRLAG